MSETGIDLRDLEGWHRYTATVLDAEGCDIGGMQGYVPDGIDPLDDALRVLVEIRHHAATGLRLTDAQGVRHLYALDWFRDEVQATEYAIIV